MNVGDLVPVEIAGTEVGQASVSEITDEWVEFIFMGRVYKTGPDVIDYFEMTKALDFL